MTSLGDLAQYLAGPITGAGVAWLLTSRSMHSRSLEERLRALEIAVATLSSRFDDLIKTIKRDDSDP